MEQTKKSGKGFGVDIISIRPNGEQGGLAEWSKTCDLRIAV